MAKDGKHTGREEMTRRFKIKEQLKAERGTWSAKSLAEALELNVSPVANYLTSGYTTDDTIRVKVLGALGFNTEDDLMKGNKHEPSLPPPEKQAGEWRKRVRPIAGNTVITKDCLIEILEGMGTQNPGALVDKAIAAVRARQSAVSRGASVA